MRQSESLRRVPRDRARRVPVSRLEQAQFRIVRPLPDATPPPADVDGAAGSASDRAAPPVRVAIIVAVAAAIMSLVAVSGSSALHEALRMAGLAGEPAIETVQRKQAVAIGQLDATVQALNAAVAGVSAHADFAGRRDEAMTRRIDQIDDGLGALRSSLTEVRAAQQAASAEEPWRKPVVQLTAAVAKAHGEIAGLRASLDDAGQARRPDLVAIGERIDRLEQAMVEHNLLGSIRGSIQDSRQRPSVSRDSASASGTDGHIINVPDIPPSR